MGRRAGTRCPSRSCQVTSQQPLERRTEGPRRQPPWQAPSAHTSAHATGTPALGLGNSQGAEPRDVPASPRAWQCLGILTFRSAGNSSFFTSPVAAAMLPAPEKAASPSWDACSFAFSATARAGGAHQCPPPCQKGCPAMVLCPAPPREGAGGEMLGRIRLLPLPCPGGEGRGGGHDTALQLDKECEQPPQILGCRPCYIRGFSRVTSAPQLASDLVSVATLSGLEGYQGRKTEGSVPEVTPCTTPWVLLPEGRKRQTSG